MDSPNILKTSLRGHEIYHAPGMEWIGIEGTLKALEWILRGFEGRKPVEAPTELQASVQINSNLPNPWAKPPPLKQQKQKVQL
eukprot:1145448-Pelagomonas_calceolata.AAC.1